MSPGTQWPKPRQHWSAGHRLSRRAYTTFKISLAGTITRVGLPVRPRNCCVAAPPPPDQKPTLSAGCQSPSCRPRSEEPREATASGQPVTVRRGFFNCDNGRKPGGTVGLDKYSHGRRKAAHAGGLERHHLIRLGDDSCPVVRRDRE